MKQFASQGGYSKVVGKAEAALLRLQEEFEACVGEEIERLRAFRATFNANPTASELGHLHMLAHNLKGLGATAGFPVISQISAQLCALLDDEDYEFAEQVGLIDDHIDALSALFAQRVRTPEHPVGRQIVSQLRQDLSDR